jgi:ABC-type transporter Mla subunit MlaD
MSSRDPAQRRAHRAAMRRRLKLELRRAKTAAVVTAIAFGLAAVSLAALIARENVHLPWQGQYVIHVAVDNAKGVVAKRNEVRWAGVVVGRVTSAELRDGRPLLTAEIDPAKAGGGRLYRDARLRLRPQTALNDLYLDIESRGHRNAGELRGDEVLQAARTREPVDVAEVLNTFNAPNRTLLKTALTQLGRGLHDNGAQLRSAFVQLVPLLRVQRRILGTFAARRGIVRRLVANSRLLTDELASRDHALRGLVRDGATTVQTTGRESNAVQRTIEELAPTFTQMRSSLIQLRGTIAQVRPALRALRPPARALPGGLAALRSFSVAATPALQALRLPIHTLTPLARDLAPTSNALADAFTRLEPQAPRLDRITQKVVPCQKAVDKFFAFTLSTFKYGNNSKHSSSPRGELVQNPADITGDTVADPTMIHSIGCADGKPAP